MTPPNKKRPDRSWEETEPPQLYAPSLGVATFFLEDLYMTIETGFFRQVMGRFTSGVTVVTTCCNSIIAGLTVSSFTSLSLDPPLILICVDRASGTLEILRESQIFAVNILTAQQVELSRCFATPSEDRFEHFCHAPYHTAATGAPILDDVLAFIDTRLVAEYPGGDHVIFVGQVEAMGTAGKAAFASEEGKSRSTLIHYKEYTDVENPLHTHSKNGTNRHGKHTIDSPLAYYRGQYRHLAQQYHEPSLEIKHAPIIEEPSNSGR
jgi:flavin reductase (DIM6/NTAB) family NADH-FMN oxidoreductase RutF